jgi:hypothetical protein
MGFTNYPNGLTSFGIPLFGGGTIPTSPGRVFFVNYGTGSDANPGTNISKPLKTVEYAYSLATSGADDIIALTGSSTHVLSAMLDVSKSRVHFIGIDGTNGRLYGQNAKISLPVTTAATDVFCMKNTGIRNSFTNIKFISDNTQAASLYCVGEGGEYAVYANCEIYKSTDLDVTGSAELVLNGDSAQFVGCTIGSLADTRVGAIIRPNVLLTAGLVGSGKVTRDCVFSDCLFWIQAANAANRFVYGANATDVERMLLFQRCGFINNLAGAGTPGQAIAMGATLTVGNIVLDPACFATKVTKLSTTTGVLVTGAAPNSGQGIAVNAA